MDSIDTRITAAIVGLLALGFGASAHAQVYVQQPVLVAPRVVVPAPYVAVAPPPVAYVAPGVGVEYVPTPLDPFVVNAAPADVVFMNGDTYIWAVDEHGNRYRRFYGHGDRRADLFHRREELHRVMERNGGHLPGREGFHGEARREGGLAHAEAHAAMERNTAMARAEEHGEVPGGHPGVPAGVHPPAAAAVHPAAAPQAHAAAPQKK